MLCRVVFTTVAVLYLLCVLWLSGLQKEDLDVNMLRKLQWHNVNIHDINEALKQECANTNNSAANITQKIEAMTTLMSTVTDDHYIAPQILIDKNYFETIAKYFTNERTSNNEPEVQETDMHSPNTLQPTNYAEYFNSTNYKAKNGVKNIVEAFRPDLEKILQFWQKFEKPNANYNQHVKKNYTIDDAVQKLPVTQITTETSQDTLYIKNINQLLSEYVSKHLIVLATTEAPTTSSYNLESNLKSLYHKLITNSNNMVIQPHAIEFNNIENVRPLGKSIKNVEDTTLLNAPIMSNTYYQNYVTSVSDISNGKESILYNSLADSFYKQSEHGNIGNSQPKVQQFLDIPNNIMRVIADSVKGLVLQDLQQEIIWDTSSSSTTPITTMNLLNNSTRTLSKSKLENKSGDSYHAIDSFLELYDQVKAIKERTIITSDTKYRMDNVNHEYWTNINKTFVNKPILDTPWRIQNVNRMHQNPIENLPLFRNLTPHEKRVHPPSIIQTNSNEIAPLVIPMSHPMNIINQILFVTSNTKHDGWAQPVTPKMITIKMIDKRYPNNKQSHEYTSSTSDRNRDHKTYPYDNYYYRIHSRLRPKYNSNKKETHDRLQEYKINHNDHIGFDFKSTDQIYNKDNSENILEQDRIYNHASRYRDREKFHEKLERGEDRSTNFDKNRYQDGKRQYRLRVASRLQQPVNSINKNFQYDDIHFRNFLKTQQKVNAMLERILATKSTNDNSSPP